MTARRALIGWYLHDHGAGHRTRFDAVRQHVDADVIVFSTLPPPMVLPAHTRWVMLDHDNQIERTESGASLDPALADPTAGGALHWAPLGHSGHASRLGMIAATLASERFDCFVVDVSVEVSLLVRLFGVPTVVFTQPGERDDAPHQLAFTIASRIIAPWPKAAHVPQALEPFRSKVCFVGGISRFDGRRRDGVNVVPGSVLVLGGGGGMRAGAAPGGGAAPGAGAAAASDAAAVLSGQVEEVAAATVAASPGTTWHALGLPASEHVSSSGWADDPFDHLLRAEVVVSFAGQNAVADLAAVRARAIVIAQPRPFDEQVATAVTLERLQLATVRTSWSAPSDWPGLLAEARASNPRWSVWMIGGAAARAAAVIAEVAARTSAPEFGAVTGTPVVAASRVFR